MGLRQSFGLFMQPVSQGGLGREVFSLEMVLQNLIFGLSLLGKSLIAMARGGWCSAARCSMQLGVLLVPTSGGPVDL
jgi:hypothetical protein